MNSSVYQLSIYRRLLADICSLTGVSLDAPVDIAYEWVLNEGPKLDKQLLGYLENGGPLPDFPEWLKPLLDRFILTDDPVLLRYLRQVLVFCYKAESLPTQQQLQDAQRTFEETDAGIEVWTTSFTSRPYDQVLASARRIVGSIIYRINWNQILPSHGPGGIFPTRLPRDKSRFPSMYASIVAKYPYDQYYCGIPSFWWDTMVSKDKDISFLEGITAKLVAVPKDSRGPRLICVHPAEAIWIQQGQRKLLEAHITDHPLTKGKIAFTDQTVNGKLALQSSKDRAYCTLDLKEASDRIACQLVKSLFGDFAYDMLSCSRATHIELLDGRVMELRKWAPMGNALTFPIQSLIFFSLVVSSIRCHCGENCSDVYVFGDDIIFPSQYYDVVVRTLVRFGMVPNVAKTFRRGFFRESCGVDAYRGIDITPLRLRKYDTSSLSSIVSLQDLALRARLAGYEECSSYIYTSIRHAMRRNYKLDYPVSNNPNVSALCEYRDIPTPSLKKFGKTRFNRRTWQLEVRAGLVSGRCHSVRNGDWYHLQDSLLRLEREVPFPNFGDGLLLPFQFNDRGTEYPIPYRSRLQYGWTPCT